MSRTPLRAAAGLTAALSLAAFAWPTDDSGAEPAPEVRMASVSEPVVVGLVSQDTTARTPGTVLAAAADQIARDIVEAHLAVEHLKAVEHLQAVVAWQAGVAEAERLAAEEVRRAEQAWAEGVARAEREQAERDRAAAAAASAAPAGSLEGIIQRHFGSAAPAAVRIAQCESGMNPNAVSPTNDHGLFQINIVHRGQFEAVTGAPWSSVYDPELNTIYARHLHAQQGWGPWTCAR